MDCLTDLFGDASFQTEEGVDIMSALQRVIVDVHSDGTMVSSGALRLEVRRTGIM